MNSHAPVTRKFISAVRRRIILVRIAESIAISIAVASVAGLALIPILWWQGQSALPLAFAMLLLGVISGLIWGISRRPTRFQAALEADRQLNLHDLLGTIYLLPDRPSDPWQESLAIISDAQCRSLRPSAVIVNRLGFRAWTGVGILGALLITTGLFTSQPTSINAAAISTESNGAASPRNAQSPIAFANQNQQIIPRPPGTGGTDDISNRAAEQNQPNDSPRDSSSHPNPNQTHSAAGTNSSIGGGAAITHSIQPPLESPASASANTALTQTTHSIAGPADSHAITPGDSNAATATEKPNHSSPPWTSTNWPADTAAAQAAINSGQVPDSNADLVRDYFRRD